MKQSYLVIIGGFFCVLAVLLSFLATQKFSPQSRGYWHYIEGYYPRLSGGYGGAPDGEYSILVTSIYEGERVVGSPYCSSYGGDLHGYWYYAEDLRLAKEWCKVWLEDNIIVLAEVKE